MIHGHGDDQSQFSFKLKADFSSNVRHDGCPNELLEHLKNQLHRISNYPEPDGSSLKEMLAKKHHVDASQVLLCNGSSDGFYQIAQSFEGSRSAILSPSFSEYEDACRMHNHQISYFTKEDFFNKSFEDVDLVWLGNPNNPDGQIFEIDLLKHHLISSPETIFVIDEAYIELSENASSTSRFLSEFNNLIVCRSLTKTYGIPGIRLGYILSSAEISSKLNQFLKPWSVNVLALEAGKYIIQNEENLKPNTKEVRYISQSLQQKIDEIDGFCVLESDTGFFLVKLEKGKASDLKQYLLEKHQIQIRDASNFKGLSNNYFRIGIQSEEKNTMLIEALKQYSNQKRHHMAVK